MKKLLIGIAAAFLVSPLIALAVQITVPSAPSGGYTLVSTSTGAYIATTTDPFHVGSLYGTSTATSTFNGGIKSPCFSTDGTNCIGSSSASSTLLTDNNTFSGNNLFSASTTFSTLVNIRNASTSLSTLGTTWFPNLTTFSLLALDGSDKVVSTTSIGNSLLANSSLTVNTNSPLGGGGAVSLGGTLTLTCATCSTATGANPTASLGLSPINGSASTFLRSDAAPALDQTIAPTMTGLWAFANTGTTTFSGGIESGTKIAAPYFIATSSSATSTLAGVINSTQANSTSTFSGGFAAKVFNATGASATSTFANGLNVSAGCFSVQGTCLGSGGSSIIGTTGQTVYMSGTNTAVGTSSVFIASNQNVGIGSTTPVSLFSVAPPGSATSIASTSVYSAHGTYTWTAPANTAYVVVQVWGAGGAGGNTNGNGPTGGGGAGAFIGSTTVGVFASQSVTLKIGQGGIFGSTGGTGYASGGNGATNGGGGGGSTGFGSFVISCGGGGGSGNGSITTGGSGASGTSGGTGGGNGGGGGCATAGSGSTPGTGGTSATGTSGKGADGSGGTSGGGGSSAGVSGNGNNASGGVGGAGSGGASGGTSGGSGGDGAAGTGADSGGGGGGNTNIGAGTAGQGGSPGAGGGGAAQSSGTKGNGADGQIIITVFTSTAYINFGALTLTHFMVNGAGYVMIGTSTPSAQLTISDTLGSTVLSLWGLIGSTLYQFSQIDSVGHLVTGGPAPTCGAGCASIQGDDKNMRILTGSSVTTVVANFANTYTKTPLCIANEESIGTVSTDASSTPTAVTVTTASALTTKFIVVHCEISNNFTF